MAENAPDASPPSHLAAEAWEVVIVGAGAAGLLAAAVAAERGRRTLLIEKNARPGIKILMSGGTRCNLTQATDAPGIIAAYGRSGRFLRAALGRLDPDALVHLIEAEGVPTKVEETGKIFPVSDRAEDVLEALLRRLARSGAVLALEEPLLQLDRLRDAPTTGAATTEDTSTRAAARFDLTTPRRRLQAQSVLIATGGRSYPGSGTTGDGYAWAAALGHTIVPPRPALTPLMTDVPWVRELKGITLPDVVVSLRRSPAGEPSSIAPASKAKPIDRRRGSLLFAHFGLSGPAALDISRFVSGDDHPRTLELVVDFLPELAAEPLLQSLKEAARKPGRRPASAILPEELPRRLRTELLAIAGVPAEKSAAELTSGELQRLAAALKGTRLPLTGTLGFKKAEVTAGGVDLSEVDPKTMQSKRVPGLFFAGEVLDLDGPIGGYNFQAAFSTGMLAGENV